MTNPGPPGEGERPVPGPDAGMGLPESGTQHATSTDFALPLDGTGEPDPVTGSRPQPVPPAYDDPTELVQPVPAYDDPDPLQAVPGATTAGTPAYDALVEESGIEAPAQPAGTGPAAGAAGALGKVKEFADQRPEAFLGLALVAGWLVGKLLSGASGDEG